MKNYKSLVLAVSLCLGFAHKLWACGGHDDIHPPKSPTNRPAEVRSVLDRMEELNAEMWKAHDEFWKNKDSDAAMANDKEYNRTHIIVLLSQTERMHSRCAAYVDLADGHQVTTEDVASIANPKLGEAKLGPGAWHYLHDHGLVSDSLLDELERLLEIQPASGKRSSGQELGKQLIRQVKLPDTLAWD